MEENNIIYWTAIISMLINYILTVSLLSPNICMFIHKSFFDWKEKNIDIIPLPKSNKIMINDNLIELEQLLQNQRIQFRECDSRMNYGMIGHLYKNDEALVLVYPGSFSMLKTHVSINRPLLRIIELIRLEFENVSRDNNGKISPVILGKI